MPRWRRWADRLAADDGSVSLEFITAGLILLVPLIYLIVAVASIQGASLAVAGAARQAARVYVTAPDAPSAQQRASRAVLFALADYGVDAGTAHVTVTCAPQPSACLTRAGHVTVTVEARATLPLIPNVLDLHQAGSVPLRAAATQTVSRFWAGG